MTNHEFSNVLTEYAGIKASVERRGRVTSMDIHRAKRLYDIMGSSVDLSISKEDLTPTLQVVTVEGFLDGLGGKVKKWVLKALEWIWKKLKQLGRLAENDIRKASEITKRVTGQLSTIEGLSEESEVFKGKEIFINFNWNVILQKDQSGVSLKTLGKGLSTIKATYKEAVEMRRYVDVENFLKGVKEMSKNGEMSEDTVQRAKDVRVKTLDTSGIVNTNSCSVGIISNSESLTSLRSGGVTNRAPVVGISKESVLGLAKELRETSFAATNAHTRVFDTLKDMQSKYEDFVKRVQKGKVSINNPNHVEFLKAVVDEGVSFQTAFVETPTGLFHNFIEWLDNFK